jgi:hypothetical protein
LYVFLAFWSFWWSLCGRKGIEIRERRESEDPGKWMGRKKENSGVGLRIGFAVE